MPEVSAVPQSWLLVQSSTLAGHVAVAVAVNAHVNVNNPRESRSSAGIRRCFNLFVALALHHLRE
jgi:hypothetical protein